MISSFTLILMQEYSGLNWSIEECGKMNIRLLEVPPLVFELARTRVTLMSGFPSGALHQRLLSQGSPVIWSGMRYNQTETASETCSLARMCSILLSWSQSQSESEQSKLSANQILWNLV